MHRLIVHRTWPIRAREHFRRKPKASVKKEIIQQTEREQRVSRIALLGPRYEENEDHVQSGHRSCNKPEPSVSAQVPRRPDRCHTKCERDRSSPPSPWLAKQNEQQVDRQHGRNDYQEPFSRERIDRSAVAHLRHNCPALHFSYSL